MADNVQNNAPDVQEAVNLAMKEQKKKKRKKKLIVLGVILVIIVLVAVVTSRPKSYDFDNPVASVTADTILNDYNNDNANATEKYYDNVVSVTGKIGSIQDDYAVIYAYDDDNWLYGVDAYMDSQDDLKSFSVGDTTTIIGVCDGTTAFGDVKLKQCIISDTFAVVPDYDNAMSVNVDDFIQAYKSNQVSADDVYKGNTIELTAVVSYVSDDYIVLEPKDADVFDWDCDIQVYFEDDEDIKKVAEDSEITVVGECYGQATMYTAKLCRAIVK